MALHLAKVVIGVARAQASASLSEAAQAHAQGRTDKAR